MQTAHQRRVLRLKQGLACPASLTGRIREDAPATSLPDVPVGATWWCVDLHLHTPGVPQFVLPAGVDVRQPRDQEQLADRYVERLRETGIEVAVITDYQGVRTEWYSLIRDRAEGITILPGAELSIDNVGKGLHLLLVCDQNTDPVRINDAIRHQGKNSQSLFSNRKQHDDLELRDPLDDTLRALRKELGCVIVAPHARDKTRKNLRILSLAYEGGRCITRARGSIDDAAIRAEIRTVLEGGADAFRRRAEKYGGLDDT